MKPLLSYLGSSIGRKTLVAVTGLLLMLFVLGHLIGNLQVFLGPDWINSYAHKLQALGPMLWVIRLGLLAVVATHILATLALVLENRKARPARYAVAAHRASTAASRSMAISGLILLCFIIFHLLHFTVRSVPGHGYNESIVMAGGQALPAHVELGYHWGIGKLEKLDQPIPHAHNTHGMMIAGFSYWYITAFYLLGMFLLCMHLSHGAASFLQTLGLRNETVKCGMTCGARLFAWAIFAGYAAIPLAVFLGLLKPVALAH